MIKIEHIKEIKEVNGEQILKEDYYKINKFDVIKTDDGNMYSPAINIAVFFPSEFQELKEKINSYKE